MALLSLRNLTLSHGGPPLLDKVEFHLERGDRVCLLGANGAGKSSLLQVLTGDLQPDSGQVIQAPNLKVTCLPQQVPVDLPGSVHEVVCTDAEDSGDHRLQLEAEQMLGRFRLDPDAEFASLSGGTRRRVLLAKALLGAPDVVLLDEPTNHLDLESIGWLEDYLLRYCRTFLFVTHDRAFLRRLATRVAELDRGTLRDWRCDYDTFLRRKDESLQAESREWELLDRKLKQEEAWLRQGVKARRTRNEGRVRALMALREERRGRRERTGSVQMSIQEGDRTGQVVLKAEKVTFGFKPEEPLIREFSTVLTRGDKVGILGPNGCGKTTLLRLLLGSGSGEPEAALVPQAGRVTHGTNLKIAYSDQLRAQLREDQSLAENVAPGQEYVMIDGTRRHIYGYLQDFLFPPERARMKVGALSGGERNRLLLAQLFAQPSNVLVLDEPTNDLDLDTLELLEEQLVSYRGTVLLVSHDREFLNNVVTGVLAFEKGRWEPPGSPWLGPEDGWHVNEYVGGYDDWVTQRAKPPAAARVEKESPSPKRASKPGLTAKERRELEQLPGRIEVLERDQAQMAARMADPAFYRQTREEIGRAKAASDELASKLEAAFRRWEALEAIRLGA